METIELNCPKCEAKLEIDEGFAGGICRCIGCATLMIVPVKKKEQTTESADLKLEHRARPDAPMPAKRKIQKAEIDIENIEVVIEDGKAEEGASSGLATYTTESGKKVRYDRRKVLATRHKQKALKAGILVGFIGLTIFLIVVCVWAVSMLSTASNGPHVDATAATLSVLGNYDPDVNPFESKTANFIGMPMGDRTVVIVDASGASRKWLDLGKKALMIGLAHLSEEKAVQFVVCTETDSFVYPKNLRPTTISQRQELETLLEPIFAVGRVDLIGAIKKVLLQKPVQIILATSDEFDEQCFAALKAILDSHPDLRFDMLFVGQDDWALMDYLEKREGSTYANIPVSRLTKWYKKAR